MKTISIYKEHSEQTMTSLEIAELTGKNHFLTSSMRHPNHLLWYPFRTIA
jgi:hypothetical protein